MEVWITEKKQTGKGYRQLPGMLLETALIFLANGIGMLILLDSLTSGIPKAPFLLSVFMSAFFCSFVGRMKKYVVFTGILSTVVAGCTVLAFSGRIIRGGTWVWNQLSEVLGKKAGIYFTVFQLNDSEQTFSRTVFWCFWVLPWEQ